MEQELNIAAILRDKPKGTKLYDLLHNIDVEFDEISTTNAVTNIWCKRSLPNKEQHFGYSERSTERGWLDGLQILKPSKDMQDWSKFAWKKGDVLISKDTDSLCVFDSFKDDTYSTFNAKYYHNPLDSINLGVISRATEPFTKVDDDEAKNFIRKIGEHYGGKLNLSTLEIEKPQFEAGDIISISSNASKLICIFKTFSFEDYNYVECYIELNAKSNYLYDGYVKYDLSVYKVRSATDSERQLLFDALAKENKAWDAEKKQIVDLPKKCEFKPKDWCLMCNFIHGGIYKTSFTPWVLSQYSHYDGGNYFAVGGNKFSLCIPFNEQTAHLLGTTDDWKGGEE